VKTSLDELLQRVNILDVVSQYVKLRKAGKDYAGLCPFHKERTPSFTVSVEKQMFYCFSCREGGNAVNFLMKYENLSFQEALENLGRQYGIEIVRKDSGKRASHFDALSKLAEYYQQSLKRSKTALQYLNDRGITDDVIQEFKLGFSDRSSGNLKSFLKNSGVPNDIFLSTGIVRMREGVLYEMFRGRIVIPIMDVNKKIIGFGGRTIEKEGFPKYVNSPESTIFSKRLSLFGIDKTRKYITENNEVFIVEGYFDFISLYTNGFKNIVSTLGTSVTEGQISKLRNYTENITLMLDGDDAGIKSALRLIELFAEMDIHGSMVVLPEAHDPDSFVRKKGAKAVREIISQKKPILDYYFDYYIKKHPLKTPEGKGSFIKSVLPHVEAIRNSVTRRLYVKRIAELTGVEENHFTGFQNRGIPGTSRSVTDSGGVIEKKVICACIANPRLLESYKGKEVLSYIKNQHVREILSKILAHFEEKQNFEVQSFIETLQDNDVRSLVFDAVFDSTKSVEDGAEKIFFDYFKHIEKQYFREESKKITEKLSEAERKGDENEITKLMEKKRQVLAYMKNNFL